MAGDKIKLLTALNKVPWAKLSRIFGNAHPSIIGLITEWWIDLNPSTHWVLDGAPAYSRNRGKADALLGNKSGPVGILEVEGYYYKKTASKIGRYFQSDRPELKGIWFGLLVLYSYCVTGSGADRHFLNPEDSGTLRTVAHITKECKGTEIIVVILDKHFDRKVDGIRSTIDYYRGSAAKIQGIRFRSGIEKNRTTYYIRQDV